MTLLYTNFTQRCDCDERQTSRQKQNMLIRGRGRSCVLKVLPSLVRKEVSLPDKIYLTKESPLLVGPCCIILLPQASHQSPLARRSLVGREKRDCLAVYHKCNVGIVALYNI